MDSFGVSELLLSSKLDVLTILTNDWHVILEFAGGLSCLHEELVPHLRVEVVLGSTLVYREVRPQLVKFLLS